MSGECVNTTRQESKEDMLTGRPMHLCIDSNAERVIRFGYKASLVSEAVLDICFALGV